MGAVSWTDLEDEALQGLPLAAQLLYLRGLRRWMDFDTGLVGEERGISWQSLEETLEVETRPGLSGERHTKGQLRRALSWLEKIGLVEDRTEGARLIFFLPKAFAASRPYTAQQGDERKARWRTGLSLSEFLEYQHLLSTHQAYDETGEQCLT